jgi:hypothetical protein
MEEIMNKITTLILVSAFLVSCSMQPVQESTTTPANTNTPQPTTSPSPAPTDTAVPTEAVTIPDLGGFSTLVVVEGFTVSVPFPLLHQVNGNVIIIGDEENTLTVSFASDAFQSGDTLEIVLDNYLGSLERRGWEFTKNELSEIEVDTATGMAVDLTATFQGLNFQGRAVAVSPHTDTVLFGLGLSQISVNPDQWEVSGQVTFATLLENTRFTQVSGACPVSTDESYGYTEVNPIRVGGDFISGVSRERAYLDHLRGPNGESLSYERQGSLPSGDTILDIYNINGPGVDEVLYVDLYNYAELQAPVGFTCEGPFPLSAP